MYDVPAPPVYRLKKAAHKRFQGKLHSYRDKLFAVPQFFDFYHPTTQWLVNVIRNESDKEINRVLLDRDAKTLLEFGPTDSNRTISEWRRTSTDIKQRRFIIPRARYFQVIDRPSHYDHTDSRSPLFGRHAVLYLTPLGLAIYMQRPKAARLLLESVDRETDAKFVMGRQPQFVAYANDRFGDLLGIYDHMLAMLSESFDILSLMLRTNNWFPMEPFELVYRKRYVETKMRFDDFMDYSFYLLFTRRSSFNMPGLCEAALRYPSSEFRPTFLCRPSRANERTLLRDTKTVINNCKSYPRRLLRCAYYADKKMKSSMNLIRAAEIFIKTGMFKLVSEPRLTFRPRNDKRRLDYVPAFQEMENSINITWPMELYEFDADCCIALLLGLISKCHRLGKRPTFMSALRLACGLMAECGWITFFDSISDLEFKDYFMGLDDAEKVVFKPEIFGFVREYVRITVIDRSHDLGSFFSEAKLDETASKYNVRDPAIITRMTVCQDEVITKYTMLPKGSLLAEHSTIITGHRRRGEHRDDPSNKYYMNKLGFPQPRSADTQLINAANIGAEEEANLMAEEEANLMAEEEANLMAEEEANLMAEAEEHDEEEAVAVDEKEEEKEELVEAEEVQETEEMEEAEGGGGVSWRTRNNASSASRERAAAATIVASRRQQRERLRVRQTQQLERWLRRRRVAAGVVVGTAAAASGTATKHGGVTGSR